MNTIISKECDSLREFASNLTHEAKTSLSVTNMAASATTTSARHSGSNVSHPERPWIIAGGASLAIGVISAISTNSVWSYVLGACGVASLYVGSTKKAPARSQKDDGASTATSVLGLEYADKILSVTRDIEDKWRNRVEEAKSNVQRAIAVSVADDDTRQSLIEKTFFTERINMQVDKYVSRLSETADRSVIIGTVSDYLKALTDTTESVSRKQTEIYMQISQEL